MQCYRHPVYRPKVVVYVVLYRLKIMMIALWKIDAQCDWTTGVLDCLDNGNEWRELCVVPRSHPLRPLVLHFVSWGWKQKGFLEYQGRAGSCPLYGGTFNRSYLVSRKATINILATLTVTYVLHPVAIWRESFPPPCVLSRSFWDCRFLSEISEIALG